MGFGFPLCTFVSFVVKGPYIIAVGGAGSFGSPAADTGKKIIKAARPASTIIPPTRYDGLLKTCGGWLGAPHEGTNCHPAQTRPSKASPPINPEATPTPPGP